MLKEKPMSKLSEIIKIIDPDNWQDKIEKLDEYRKGILEANEMVNMTRITELEEFNNRHYIDSMMCCQSDEFLNAQSIIDVGSGGGFPGVPLALMFPEKQFTLLDSSRKRMNIVSEILSEMNIDNVVTIHARAEELGRNTDYRESYDLCVSRAVASLPSLCEFCIPFVKTGGTFISYKGPKGDEELEQAKNAISKLGGQIGQILESDDTIFKAHGNEGHKLIFIKKISATPSQYPRGGGKPLKKPL